jgi:hypothetical protein
MTTTIHNRSKIKESRKIVKNGFSVIFRRCLDENGKRFDSYELIDTDFFNLTLKGQNVPANHSSSNGFIPT